MDNLGERWGYRRCRSCGSGRFYPRQHLGGCEFTVFDADRYRERCCGELDEPTPAWRPKEPHAS